MTSIRILVPEESTNYIQNPSMRYDTTGWNSSGSTISRTLERARFGIAALKIVTTGSVVNEGAYYRVRTLTGVSEPITASVYVRGSGIVRIRLIDNPVGTQWSSKAIKLRSDRWTRLHVTGYSTGRDDMRLYVETQKGLAQIATFYITAAQMERKVYPTTYIDGDQPGCRWIGSAHGSNSTRSPYIRAGGRWVSLAGPEQEEKDLYVTVINGFGVASISNTTNPFALIPGSYYQNTTINDRIILMTFHAKHEDRRLCSDSTLKHLHYLRQTLFEIIKPNKTAGGEEFIIEYEDGGCPVYVRARYEAGLEGEWDIRNKWYNAFPVRFLSVSPILFEDDLEVYTVDFQDNAIMNNVASRIDGEWTNTNYGFNGNVNDFEIGARQELIAVGAFTTANNSAIALNPSIAANRIASWDGEKWSTYGAGANGAINDAAVAPNGYIYVTGEFTSIGGVAANRVAFWDGSAWNAMSTGLNGNGYNIQVAPNGDVYVGGTFTTAGGVTAKYIARWNGVSWYSLGPYLGLNGDVLTITISADGNLLYCGGDFTDEFGSPGSVLTRVAVYNTLTGLFDNMGSGFDDTVRELIVSPTGELYAGGDFTLSGTDTVNYISQWNGAAWTAMSSGMNSAVYSIAISPVNGDLIAVGIFTQAGSASVKKVALWNGSAWTNLDINIGVGNSLTEIYAVQFLPNGDLFLGGTQFSASVYPTLFSGITNVDNSGTAEASPKLYVRGPGTLRWIENQTTQKRVFMNLAILSGEDVFIDFAKGSIVSSVRGNLLFTILPGSDFRAFTLLSGNNKMAIFMENDVGALMQLSYTPHHWSADATYCVPTDVYSTTVTNVSNDTASEVIIPPSSAGDALGLLLAFTG